MRRGLLKAITDLYTMQLKSVVLRDEAACTAQTTSMATITASIQGITVLLAAQVATRVVLKCTQSIVS